MIGRATQRSHVGTQGNKSGQGCKDGYKVQPFDNRSVPCEQPQMVLSTRSEPTAFSEGETHLPKMLLVPIEWTKPSEVASRAAIALLVGS